MCKNIAGELITYFGLFKINLCLFLNVILPMPYGLAGYAKAFCASVVGRRKIICGFPVLRKVKE